MRGGDPMTPRIESRGRQRRDARATSRAVLPYAGKPSIRRLSNFGGVDTGRARRQRGRGMAHTSCAWPGTFRCRAPLLRERPARRPSAPRSCHLHRSGRCRYQHIPGWHRPARPGDNAGQRGSPRRRCARSRRACRVLARHAFEVLDERGPAVRDVWVMLRAGRADVAVNRLLWSALVEHEIVERDCIIAVLLGSGAHGWDSPVNEADASGLTPDVFWHPLHDPFTTEDCGETSCTSPWPPGSRTQSR